MHCLRNIYICLLIAMVFSGCHRPRYIQQHSYKIYPVSKEANADNAMTQLLLPYKQKMDSLFDIVIGRTDTILYKSQPECTLGNFMADVVLASGKKINPAIDAAVFNYGGIRVPYIVAGNITIGKIFELMPFDNQLVILEMPGDTLMRFCNHMAALKGWPVSGISYIIKDKKAEQISVNGIAVDPKRVYVIATNDYLANGGDYCSFLTSLKRTTTNTGIRDILIENIRELAKQNKPLHPYIENRIRYAE